MSEGEFDGVGAARMRMERRRIVGRRRGRCMICWWMREVCVYM